MADTKTSAESDASTLDGTELVRIVQSGANAKATTQDIADLAFTGSEVGSLTAASALDGTELFYGVQGGADRKVTGTQLKALTLGTANTFTEDQTIESGNKLVIKTAAFDQLEIGGNATGTISHTTNALGVHYYLSGDNAGDGTSGAWFGMGAQGFITWQSTNRVDAGSKDVGIARNAAGVLEVNTGTPGTLAAVKVKTVQHTALTVATLPTGVAGATAYVTDGDAALAWGATVVNSGSGATKYLVWYNGSNWTVAGK